jgi:uncharacterized protein YybS (DUF2232 family)
MPDRGLLFDIIKCSALTLALFLAYVTFPLIGMLPGIISPLPLIYCYGKRGATAGLTVLLITVAVLAVMSELPVLLLYLLQSGIIGLLLPRFYLLGKGAARSIVYTVTINSVLLIAAVVAFGIWTGADLQGTMLKGIAAGTDQAISAYSKQGIGKEDLEALAQSIKQAGELIARIFPALLLISFGSVAAMNMALFFRLAARWLPNLPQPEGFSRFRNPEMLVWVLIVAGFAMLLPHPDIQRAALNVLVVCGFIYFLQGLAVIMSFFQRMAVPTLARTIFWLFLMIQPYLTLAVAFLGVFDIWADFRTPKEKNL